MHLLCSSKKYLDKVMENNDINVLYFNTRDELLRVDLRKVLYFQSDRNYTDVYFVNGVHVTLPTGLMAIEQMLDDDKIRGRVIPFVRLGRCFIVNLSYILRINVPKQELLLSDIHTSGVYKISVSKEALRKLKDMYNQKDSNQK